MWRTKRIRKFIPKLRCCMSRKHGLWFRGMTELDDEGWISCGSTRLNRDNEIEITRTGEMKELACWYHFVFNTFLNFKAVKRLQDLGRVGGSGSRNNGTCRRVLKLLVEAFQLSAITQWVAVIKTWVYQWHASNVSCTEVKNSTDTVKNADMVKHARETADTCWEKVRWESKMKPCKVTSSKGWGRNGCAGTKSKRWVMDFV